MEVHQILGPGFLEPVYQAALEVEFGKRQIPNEREVELSVYYKDEPLGVRYRTDFVCFGGVLIELLLNFGVSSLQYRRFVGPTFQSVSESVQSVDQVS